MTAQRNTVPVTFLALVLMLFAFQLWFFVNVSVGLAQEPLAPSVNNSTIEEIMPILDQTKLLRQQPFLCENGAALLKTYEADPESGLYYREIEIRSHTYFIGSHDSHGYFLTGWFSHHGNGKVSESGTRDYFVEKYPSPCDLVNKILGEQQET